MKLKGTDLISLLLVLGALWLAFGGGLPIPGFSGATLFIVLHEATKDDNAFAELTQELQDLDSPVAKEIKAAGWRTLVLDDDAMDKDDKPLPLFEKLGVYGSIADSRRELLAIAPPDKLVSKEPIPAGATADSVLAMIKARGKR